MLSPLLQVVSHAFQQTASAAAIIILLAVLTGYIALLERRQLAKGSSIEHVHLRTRAFEALMTWVGRLLESEDSVGAPGQRLGWLGAILALAAVMAAAAVISFGPFLQVADLDIGLLFVMAVSALGVYGILLGASTDRNSSIAAALIGHAARFVGYQAAACFALLAPLILAGSLSIRSIVEAQDQTGVWFGFPVIVGLCIYFVSSAGVLDRAPFDVHRAALKSTAAPAVEASGPRWAIYFLGENVATILVACVAVTVFLGGWLRPLASFHDHFFGTSIEFLDATPAVLFVLLGIYFLQRPRSRPDGSLAPSRLAYGVCFSGAGVMSASLLFPATLMPLVHGTFWFLAKVMVYLYVMIWFRFTFPKSRFDELMNFGWRFLLPLSLANVVCVAVAQLCRQQLGWNTLVAFGLATVVMGVLAVWLALDDRDVPDAPAPVPIRAVQEPAEELVSQ